MIGLCQSWNLLTEYLSHKFTSFTSKNKRTAFHMVLDETYMDQIFKFNVCDDPSQVTGKHILTPADHSQSIDIPLTKNHHTPPVPADAKIALAPLPAQEQFSHPDALYVGVVCLPPHRWQIFFPKMGKPAS